MRDIAGMPVSSTSDVDHGVRWFHPECIALAVRNVGYVGDMQCYIPCNYICAFAQRELPGVSSVRTWTDEWGRAEVDSRLGGFWKNYVMVNYTSGTYKYTLCTCY